MKLTFVVPAYRVAPFLRECVQSMLCQNDSELRVIVVDDGSPDESGAIADQLASADNRVTALHQPNSGVSVARNAGLEAATGDWVWFVDGDDLIDPIAVRQLARIADPALDVVCFRHVMYPGGTAKPGTGECKRLSDDELAALRAQNVYAMPGSPVGQITATSASFCVYRRAFLLENDLRFDPSIPKGQDSLFHFHALLRARSVAFLDAVLYQYRRHAGSISVRYVKDMPAKTFAVLAAYDALLKRYGLDDDAELKRRRLCRAMQMTRVCLCLDFSHADNPKPYHERRADFRRYMDAPPIRDAFADLSILGVSAKQRLVYRLIALRAFGLLNGAYRAYTRRCAP